MREDSLQLFPGEGHGLRVGHVGLLHRCQWIHRDDAIQDRLLQGGARDGMAVGHGAGRQAGVQEIFPVHPERHRPELVQWDGADRRIGDVPHDAGVGLYGLGRHGVSQTLQPGAAPFSKKDVVIHHRELFISRHLGIPLADGFRLRLSIEMTLPAIYDSSYFIIPIFSPGHRNQPPLWLK